MKTRGVEVKFHVFSLYTELKLG